MDQPIKPEIYLFLQDLLAEKGINVDAETETQMVQQLNDRLQVLFTQVITEHMPEQDIEMLESKITQGEEVTQEFLQEKIPNINELFIQAMADFRRAFLQG